MVIWHDGKRIRCLFCSDPASLLNKPPASRADPRLNSTSLLKSNLSKSLPIYENHFGFVEESKVKKKPQKSEDRVKWIPQKHSFLTTSFSKPAGVKEMQDLLADFR